MLVLGLTGSIGMGKSATAEMFRQTGVPVFDADAAVHAIYAAEGVAPVKAAFPGVVRNGRVDRTLLRDTVLADPAALQRLEALVHPLVAARRRAFLDEAQMAGVPIVVLDIPLLFETGQDIAVDAIVVVSANEAVQRARVLARPGMTEDAFSAILAKQMPDAEKRRRADHVIRTDAGFDAAREDVVRLLDGLRLRAARL